MANKVKYGLSNVYYAVATIASDGSATYDTPVALPGARALTMDAQGDRSNFYADNIVYFVGNANNGYSGSLEVALLPDSFKTDVLGYGTDSTKKMLVERKDAAAVHFALIFQFDGDAKNTRHVIYNCTASRPSANGNTVEEAVEPETESIDIEATSIYVSALDGHIVKASTTENTSSTDYAGFVSSVYIPSALS